MSIPELAEFSMSKLIKNPGANIVIIGKKNTGKSTLIKDILAHVSEIFPVVIAMSGSESTNNFYKKMLPDIFVWHDINASKFAWIHQRQQEFGEKVRKGEKSFEGLLTGVGLIIDDCIANVDWTKDDHLTWFITNGRHLPIILLIAVQSFKKLPPVIRTNIDYGFVLMCNNYTERKKIREELMGMVENKSQFDGIFNKYTDNFKCIVVDNVSKSTELQDLLYWYKANPDLKPKLCHQIYWDVNDILIKQTYEMLYRRAMEKKQLTV